MNCPPHDSFGPVTLIPAAVHITQFLALYSACEKLPCCGIGLSLITRQPILFHRAAKSSLLQGLLRISSTFPITAIEGAIWP
jgi:hypothetical protein